MYPSVPSGAPRSLEVMFVQPTEVSLRWREVPCVQQNGPITGYVVRYYATHGDDRDIHQNKSVVTTGDIIDGLTPNTEYAFQVAAVNVNGTGPFSEPITLRGKMVIAILFVECRKWFTMLPPYDLIGLCSQKHSCIIAKQICFCQCTTLCRYPCSG